MRPGVVVVLNICPKDLIQVPLVEDDEVIQTFSSDRANNSFSKGVLPSRSRSDEYFIDVHGFHPVDEHLPVDLVPIADRVFWLAVVRKRCGDLVSRPASCWMTRDVEMDDVPPVVSKDDKAIQDVESDRRDGEEIDSCDLFGMVLQERSPRLGRRFTLLVHVFRHRRVCHFKSKQGQF